MVDEPVDIDFTRIAKEVEALNKAIDGLKQAGIDEEVLIAYLNYKTKISIRDIRALLKGEKEFFKKLNYYR